ncbi:SDR family NAD(P)-dependent oxidoreductase [Sphingomonas glacialis]|uniref:SDR family NAD(P)-dependent oxidoreductase n=1 Tax=Sphingomonas glacialis TaxID=658225 RepID=A0A502FS08_9SPHN|nr:SDR family NAD(P)-dependent oxidoreductase [Sphingomonas glacialis]TPG52062.1 SDR family NAD(P)-dependent oxidoreductase [Sphingomonas glacialis]
MDIKGSVALVTGANGGIGSAFVHDLLERGATKVYVAARDQKSLADLLAGGDPRLVPITLDVTDPAQVAQAAIDAPDVTFLINNAGYAAFAGSISAPDMDDARREMDVNYFGTLAMTRAFAPALAASGGGAILNMLSMLALVSLPAAATYAASKAAGLSLTRSIRAELSAQGTVVLGVLAVQTETAMGVKLPEPRMQPSEVVADALDAVQAGRNDEVVAGAQTRGIHDAFTADPKAVQAKMSTVLPKAA